MYLNHAGGRNHIAVLLNERTVNPSTTPYYLVLTHSGNLQPEVNKREIEYDSSHKKQEGVQKLDLRRVNDRCDDDKDGDQAGDD